MPLKGLWLSSDVGIERPAVDHLHQLVVIDDDVEAVSIAAVLFIVDADRAGGPCQKAAA